MTANWTPKARKTTVTKEGVRGDRYRATVYAVTLPWGEVIKHADSSAVKRLAQARVDRRNKAV
jgi:GH24 family phage-related lysozyme (muramidase)